MIDEMLSADESTLAMACKLSEEREDMYVKDRGSGEVTRITSEGINRHPKLSADGTKLVYQQRLNRGLPVIRYRDLLTGKGWKISPEPIERPDFRVDYSLCYIPDFSPDASAAAFLCGIGCEPGIAFCQSMSEVWAALSPKGRPEEFVLLTPPGTLSLAPSLNWTGDRILFGSMAFYPETEKEVEDANGLADVYMCTNPGEEFVMEQSCYLASLDADGQLRPGWTSYPKFSRGDDSKFSSVSLVPETNGWEAKIVVSQIVDGGFEVLGEFSTGLPVEGAKVAPRELAYHSMGGAKGEFLLFHPTDRGFILRRLSLIKDKDGKDKIITVDSVIVDDVVGSTRIRGGEISATGALLVYFDVEGNGWTVDPEYLFANK